MRNKPKMFGRVCRRTMFEDMPVWVMLISPENVFVLKSEDGSAWDHDDKTVREWQQKTARHVEDDLYGWVTVKTTIS